MISVRMIQTTITIYMIFSEWSNNNVNSYDFCQNDAKDIEIHMISVRMMQNKL